MPMIFDGGSVEFTLPESYNGTFTNGIYSASCYESASTSSSSDDEMAFEIIPCSSNADCNLD